MSIFSLRFQLIALASIFLVSLPWLGYRYIGEMKEYLVSGQGDAQLLAAQAVATVLHDRSDLFDLSGEPGELPVEESSLHVYPLDSRIVVDGYRSDWGRLLPRMRRYAGESLVYDRTAGVIEPASFGLLLGESEDYLFGLLSVADDRVVYRHPGYARLDSSDQVRLALIDGNGDARRYVLLAEAPGTASVYEMQADWIRPVTGRPVYALSAVWQDRSNGYDVEFRVPQAWVSAGQQLMISVADVDSESERKIDNIVATLPASGDGRLNRLIRRNPELDRIIGGLGAAGSGVCIVDRYRRVRALLGVDDSGRGLCSLTDRVAPEMVAASLQGDKHVYRTTHEGAGEMIIASHPIYQDGSVNGVVLVEKSSAGILGEQRKTLIGIIAATAIAVLAAILGLLLFSGVLTYRIRSLQREVSASIDPDGRLLETDIRSNRSAKDEIGELSRGFSKLLSQLGGYTGFLENVPRTLRHEILNPLNTISMSIQKMQAADSYEAGLVRSAKSAIRQLEIIVQSLTEAASIDGALEQDMFEAFSLDALLSEYVVNIRRKHAGRDIALAVPRAKLMVRGSDIRITQMLDKLKDNAIDFAAPGTGIEFVLREQAGMARLSVCNDGPTIPADIAAQLCEGIISRRPVSAGEPHLGIGLYVASRIARHHGGSLKLHNKPGRDGVCAVVRLPVADRTSGDL